MTQEQKSLENLTTKEIKERPYIPFCHAIIEKVVDSHMLMKYLFTSRVPATHTEVEKEFRRDRVRLERMARKDFVRLPRAMGHTRMVCQMESYGHIVLIGEEIECRCTKAMINALNITSDLDWSILLLTKQGIDEIKFSSPFVVCLLSDRDLDKENFFQTKKFFERERGSEDVKFLDMTKLKTASQKAEKCMSVEIFPIRTFNN